MKRTDPIDADDDEKMIEYFRKFEQETLEYGS